MKKCLAITRWVCILLVMTNTQIQNAIKTARACLEREMPLDRELELAEFNGKATSRIKADIKRNNNKLNKMIDKLAREQMKGTVIEYNCGTMDTIIEEEIEDIEWKEGN